MSAERARDQANTRSFLERLAASGHRGSLELIRPRPRPARAWPAPEKPRPSRPSAKARKRAAISSKDSLQRPRQQGNSARPESTPRPSRASSPVVKIIPSADHRQSASLHAGRVQPRQHKTDAVVPRASSIQTTEFSSSETPGSIKAWTPDGPSSRCRRPECRPRNLTKSCARKTRNC